MKRVIVLSLLCLISTSLFAQFMGRVPGYMAIGVDFINTSHNFTTGNGTGTEDINVSGIAAGVTSFSGSGDFGFYAKSVFGLPISGTQVIDKTTENTIEFGSSGINVIIDLICGVGYKIEMNYVIIIGGPLHFSGLATDSDDNIFLSYTIGPGIAANFIYPIVEGLYLNVSASVGYDFWEIMHIPDLPSDADYAGGLTWSAGAGLAFKM